MTMPPTLWDLNEDERASISDIDPQLDEELITRLREIGLDNQRQVECIKKLPFGGPKVYQLGDSVFSLERDLANKVTISRDRG